jgi:hypothetical protein
MAIESRPVTFSFAGVSSADLGGDVFHDMPLRVHYLEIYANPAHVWAQAAGKQTYETLLAATPPETSPFIMNYYVPSKAIGTKYGISSAASGLYPLGASQQSYGVSFYRREYRKYANYVGGKQSSVVTVTGEWEPVTFSGIGTHIRDMNVQSGHTYEYVAYPSTSVHYEVRAVNQTTGGSTVTVGFPCWSITELTETDQTIEGSPTVKKVYQADLNNIWLLKFGLDSGAQSQNLARSEIQTLGAYPRYSQGLLNAASGSISCYLGSEVIPFDSEGGYVERLWAGIDNPGNVPSTNSGAAMLRAWKKFVYSKNPKLLKDMKGDSWIVQIESSSATPSNYIYGQPTQISFAWKQIATRDYAVIYGDGATMLPTLGQVGSRWIPVD